MKKLILIIAFIALVPQLATSESRKYACSSGSVDITFTVKESKSAAPDKISGKIFFKLTRFTGKVKGHYEPVTNTLVGTLEQRSGDNIKIKAFAGEYDSDSDTFNLSVKLKKGLSAEFICAMKDNKKANLAGTWVINSSSFFSVILEEDASGNITGKGGKGFEDYVLAGTHPTDTLIDIDLISPDGQDNSSHSLRVCGSKSSMVGIVTGPLGGQSEVVWCRKSRALNQECTPDTSC